MTFLSVLAIAEILKLPPGRSVLDINKDNDFIDTHTSLQLTYGLSDGA